MLVHHIQKHILERLVHSTSTRYADLRPANVDGNVFTYHLQQLIKAGPIEKTDDGLYCLTSAGKAEGISSKLTPIERQQQAHAVLLIAIRDAEGRWLLRKRTVHPMFGRTGFVHGEPKAGEPVIVTAQKRLLHKTGLSAELTIAGSGFITIFQRDDLESYSQFTLLTGTVTAGDLLQKDETGENNWQKDPDFTSDAFVPSMPDLVHALNEFGESKTFFKELTYTLQP